MASTGVLLSLIFVLYSIFMHSKLRNFIYSTNDGLMYQKNDGFSISIIHRDSPESPLYNHSLTPHETRIAQLHRSISRMRCLSLRARAASQSQNPPDISTNISYDPDSAEYIASYYIGTPPTQVYAFVDTGSDLIWTNSRTAFNSSKSSSYEPLQCKDNTCQQLPKSQRTCRDGPCTYEIKYADKSTASGVLSQDKFWFDAAGQSLPKDVGFISFGYSTNVSSSQFVGKDINGCLGLSRDDPFSLISQLGIKRFSHCFVQGGSGISAMHFGSTAVIHVKDLTPLVKLDRSEQQLYYVNLEGISVGNTKVNVTPGTFNRTRRRGGFYVDGGSNYSMLRRKGYDPFLKLMKNMVAKPEVPSPPGLQFLEFCFNGTKKDLDSLPRVTFHFAGGVDVKLTNDVTYVEFDGGVVWCLGIIRSSYDESLLGNIQMANLNVGYDLERNGVSFTSADCSAVGGLVQAI